MSCSLNLVQLFDSQFLNSFVKNSNKSIKFPGLNCLLTSKKLEQKVYFFFNKEFEDQNAYTLVRFRCFLIVDLQFQLLSKSIRMTMNYGLLLMNYGPWPLFCYSYR